MCVATNREMWDNEKKHLEATSNMLDELHVRPSALMPVWAFAGRTLGGSTALLGRKCAMACTEAVETVIGEHYDEYVCADSQLEHLAQLQTKLQSQGVENKEDLDDAFNLLRSVLVEFRDDELEHLDTAVEHDAQQAPAHALLSVIVGYGCKAAIEVAKRV